MRLDFAAREAAANLKRHRLAAFASVTSTWLCLLLLGAFVLAAMLVGRLNRGLLRQSGIAVYLQASTPRDRSEQVRAAIAALPGVASTRLVPRETAWREEKQKYGRLPELDAMENPLGDEIRVLVTDPERSPAIAARLSALPGVEETREGRDVEERLIRLGRAFRAAGGVVSALLLFAAALIIGNAIRLGVASRRREIRIMRLVGATDGFIRMPFLLEGLFYGAAGSLLAIGALAAGGHVVQRFVAQTVPFLPVSTDGLPVGELFGALALAGAAFGVAGSVLAVNRCLREEA